jgi:hypothetical protein
VSKLLLAVVGLTLGMAGRVSAAGVDEQNAFVKSHCAVCHSDRANNGGLSLEGFDAAVAAPSLAAMMLSKITSGTAVATVNAAAHDASAAGVLDRGLKNGAVNAAGLGVPARSFVDELVTSFAAKSAAATRWSLERAKAHSGDGEVVTASIARELPAAAGGGRPGDVEAAMYRLVISCNPTAREGAMQLAWSPIPKEGRLAVAVDNQPPAIFKVEGKERMGNGGEVTTGPAAYTFARFGGTADARLPLPRRTLTVSELFPGETVAFPFDQLGKAAREALSACFK